MSVDLINDWNGEVWWGSIKKYPEPLDLVLAVEAELGFVFGTSGSIEEIRMRHCVGTGCGEDGEPHWHPTESKYGTPMWQVHLDEDWEAESDG